jgi:predicted Zn-dependent peptidase
MSPDAPDPDTLVTTLPNGARVVVIRLPHLQSACVSVFVRTGSRYESRRQNGISHMVEHMAFKGTHERSCQRINLDAERLGAEVNAHTDKDHTAYHMRGLAGDAGTFIRMLADIVLHSSFPEAELERERQVILQEVAEDEDDPLSTAFKLFDKTCFGDHPLAQPVIGTCANIRRFTRADLVDYVGARYSAANLVVGVAGDVDPDAMAAQVQAAFGAMPAGRGNEVAPPAYLGGLAARGQPGVSQVHVVLGFPLPGLREDYAAGAVAAAVFGEGMSSPLMDELRERRGLVYYAACSADMSDLCGQFIIEASTAPEHLDEFFTQALRLLAVQARGIQPVDLERARKQLAVRSLAAQEQPFRRLEDAAQDLFMLGRVRSRGELQQRLQAVTAGEVRDAFERMLAQKVAVALAGRVRRGITERVGALLQEARFGTP